VGRRSDGALAVCPPYAAKWKDWSVGGTLSLLEQYNGLGYATKGIPSPYIWSGTDQYSKGKYVADHMFDPSVVDAQFGCAGLILGDAAA
jgi:lysozyme family protein